MKALKELVTFNKEKRIQVFSDSGNPPNGIACPDCGCELRDIEPMRILDTDMPQRRVGCPNCGYMGWRTL